MPVQYADGVRAEHEAVRIDGRRLRRVAHGRGRVLRSRRRGAAAAPVLQRRLAHADRRRAVLDALPRGRRRARRPLHVPARPRSLPDRDERLQPRVGRRLDPRQRRRLRRRDRGRRRRPRDARRAGPARARDRPGDLRQPAARAHARRPRVILGRDALVCGTGYTGEDGVELLLSPDDARAGLGRVAAPRRHRLRPGGARHPAPGGLLPAVRQRPVERPQPDRGRPWLGVQGGHRVHRLAGRSACPRGGHRAAARRVHDRPAPASRARATRSSAGAR